MYNHNLDWSKITIVPLDTTDEPNKLFKKLVISDSGVVFIVD